MYCDSNGSKLVREMRISGRTSSVCTLIFYPCTGAFVFMSLEHDREEAARIAKEMKTKVCLFYSNFISKGHHCIADFSLGGEGIGMYVIFL